MELSTKEISPSSVRTRRPFSVPVMLNSIHSPATHDPELPAGANSRCIKVRACHLFCSPQVQMKLDIRFPLAFLLDGKPLYRVKTSRPLIGSDVTTIFRFDGEIKTEIARITWNTFRSSVIEFGSEKLDYDKFLVPRKPFSKSRLIHANGETFRWKRNLELYNSQNQLVAKYHRPSNPNSLAKIKESQYLELADRLDGRILDIVIFSFVILWTRERQSAAAQADA